MILVEKFRPTPMAADTSTTVGGVGISGFLAKTAGTITVVDAAGVTVVDAVPLTAGAYTPIPLMFDRAGNKTITLGGGASGTLFS